MVSNLLGTTTNNDPNTIGGTAGSSTTGYSPTSVNRQTTQNLAIPGVQAYQGGPGVLGGRFPNYGTSSFSIPSSYSVPSSFDLPQQPQQQQQPSQQPSSMNPYLKSSNLSTLLRVLVGNTDNG